MARTSGKLGMVKVGTDSVAEVKDWNFSETCDVIDSTAMGDSAKQKVATFTSASGSLTAWWDSTDTDGQGALKAGNTVTLKLYTDVGLHATTGLQTPASGDVFYEMSAIISERGVTTTMDGWIETSFSFEVSGAITLEAI